MRAGLVVTGVLGAGTAIVFAIAGLVATLFPSGTLIGSQWNGGCFDCGFGKGGIEVPMPMPVPVPGIEGIPEKGFVIQRGVAVDVAPMPASTDGDILVQP